MKRPTIVESIIVAATVLAVASLLVMMHRQSRVLGSSVPLNVPIHVARTHFGQLPPASSMRPIDGITCDQLEGAAYHIHAHLSLYSYGKSITIPANTGIPSDACLYWLHTHDDTGIVHVEAPGTFQPLLGYFFDIWGQPLNRTRAGAVLASRGHPMKVFVDSKVFSGNPWYIVLRDYTDITIEVGPPYRTPIKYDFAGNGY